MFLSAAVVQGQPARHVPLDRGAGRTPASIGGTGTLFIENRGQIVDTKGERRPDILYTVDGGAVRLFLRRGGISYVFQRVEPDSTRRDGPLDADPSEEARLRSDRREELRGGTVTTYRMDAELVGSNPAAPVSAGEPTDYHTNYYLAHCPDGITNVASYRRVIYHDIYPKIDLVFHSDSGGVKYDFVVHPGGDPRNIRLRYTGADALERTGGGSLRVTNMLGTLTEGVPVSYQHEGGTGGAIACRYMVEGDEVGFALGSYDRSRTLVIDPLLQWATYIGGSSNEVPSLSYNSSGSVTTDAEGNVAVCGATSSVDFPIVAGAAFQEDLSNQIDAYIIKFTKDGQLLWSTYLGGSQNEGAEAISASPVDGSLAVGGGTYSLDFPISDTPIQASIIGMSEAFIGLFNADGVRQWLTYYGGSEVESVSDIGVDGSGSVVATGGTWSPDLLLSSNPFQAARSGAIDAYLIKITSGGALDWATYYGGPGHDLADGLVIDRTGAIIISGNTGAAGLPLANAGSQPAFGGGVSDCFVTKFTAAGQPVWATYFGGSAVDDAFGLACDSSDNIVLCGRTFSTDLPITAPSFQPTYTGGVTDAFIMKFNGNGARLWGTYYGGTLPQSGVLTDEGALGVCIAPNNDIFITGYTRSADFPVTPDAPQAASQNELAAFLLQFGSGGARIWASYYGSPPTTVGDLAIGIAADNFGGIYITGGTSSQSGLPGATLGYQPVSGGQTDGFLAKFAGLCSMTLPSLPPVKLCDNGSATLTAPPGYRSYRWTPGNGAASDTVVSQPGIYTLTAIDQNWCIAQTTVEVRPVPRPRPVIVPRRSLVLCEGDSVLLDATLGGIVRYRWSTGQTTPVIAVKKAGRYNVQVTDTNGCSDSARAVIVVVNPRPARPVLPAGPLWICPDSSLTLAPSEKYAAYQWSTGATTPTIKVSGPGRYSLTVYNEFGCPAYSDTVTVRQYARPVPVIALHGPAVLCEGDSVDLEVTGGPFASGGIRWSNGRTGAVIRVGKSGTYSVMVRSVEGCVGGPATAVVTVRPGPRAEISGPEEVCLNAITSYQAPEGSTLRYRWELTGDGVIVGASDGPRARVQWGSSGSGVLRLTVTDAVSGCGATSIRQVTIGTSLKPVITAGGPLTFCRGDSVLLEAGYGMKRYRWSTGDTTEYIIVSEAAFYTVTVEDSSGCTGTSSPVEVRVVDRPVPAISGPVKVCSNTTGSYAATDVAGHEYTWTVTGGVIVAGQGSSRVTVQWGIGPAGTVDLMEASGEGLCQGSAERLNVAIGSDLEPAITASGPLSFCRGDSVTLDAGDGYASYEWSGGEITRTITVRQSGSYSVTVSDAGGCGGTSKPVTVAVSPPADPVITPLGPTTFCSGDSVALDAGADFARYRWSSGDTTQVIIARAAGNYTVEVTTIGGCSASSAPVSITVEERPAPVISGAIKVCQNSTSSYGTVGLPGHGYQWTVSGGVVSGGQGTNRITVQWGSGPDGTIDLVETNATGRCRTEAQRYLVSIGTELEPVITPNGRIDLCEGDSALLDAGSGYARYEWSTGETSQTITVRGNGDYTVRVWDAGGCNGSARPVAVLLHAPPQPAITPGGPLKLPSGGSVRLDAGAGYVKYLWSSGDTTRLINVKDNGRFTVAVVDSFGCTGESAPVTVEFLANIAGFTRVKLPVVEGAPGERVVVPLALLDARDMPASALEFRARLRYRASLLQPVGGTPAGDIQGSERVIELGGTLPAGITGGRLLELEFMALLGDTIATPLTLEEFLWSDSTITVVTGNGEFRLTGLCISGPTRLVGAAGHLVLKPVRPNPAAGYAEIEYEVIESGLTRLELVDMRGTTVARISEGEQTPGRYRAGIDVSALESGTYIVVLRTPTRRLTTPMQVKQ